MINDPHNSSDHTRKPLVEQPQSYAGAWADLPEDDEIEALDKIRRTTAPTPPIDEQLRWLDEE